MASSTNPLAGRNFQDETGARIVPGEKLGEGGEGVVHLVDGQPGSVMKVWHPGRTPQDADLKIRHLINNPVGPELGETWQITWPQHMVIENRVLVGYTMPRLDDLEEWEPIVEYYNRRAAQTTGAAQAREIRIDDRVRMARNLALGFRAVHEAGYVIGDVNEKNVEVNRQNDIAMVDCDSYGFTDPATGRTFSNEMGRPEFQARKRRATIPTGPVTMTCSVWQLSSFTCSPDTNPIPSPTSRTIPCPVTGLAPGCSHRPIRTLPRRLPTTHPGMR